MKDGCEVFSLVQRRYLVSLSIYNLISLFLAIKCHCQCKRLFVSVRSQILTHIDEMRIHFGTFDIFGVCETWLRPSVTSQMIIIHGYKLYRIDRDRG